jgi:hypothetical protein
MASTSFAGEHLTPLWYAGHWLSCYLLWFVQVPRGGARWPTRYQRGLLLGAFDRRGVRESECAWHRSPPPKLPAHTHRPCLKGPRATCSGCACAAGGAERGKGWLSHQRKGSGRSGGVGGGWHFRSGAMCTGFRRGRRARREPSASTCSAGPCARTADCTSLCGTACPPW